ncbi:MAG: AAA family ATPase [Firmicutes bacterium]|nr:AAA family ATPase [Bacillota bacterium]
MMADALDGVLRRMAALLEPWARWELAQALRRDAWPVGGERLESGGEEEALWRLAAPPDTAWAIRQHRAQHPDAGWAIAWTDGEGRLQSVAVEWADDPEGADGDLRIAAPARLAAWPAGARLVCWPAGGMEEVAERLRAAAEGGWGNRPLAGRALGLDPAPDLRSPAVVEADGLHPAQALAVERALASPFTCVWGPPGTGKTTVIAAILDACAGRGERAWIVAPTHAAVDEAVVRLAERWARSPEGARALADGLLAREGRRISPALAARRWEAAGVPWAEALVRERRSARRDRGRRAAALAEAWAVRPGAADVAAEIRGIPWPDGSGWEGRPVDARSVAAWAEAWAADPVAQGADGEPAVVGMTLARAARRDPAQTPAPDVVVVDEATMAPLPLLALAALWPRRRLVVVGDPRQLPAVHPPLGIWPPADRVDAARWCLRDAFAVQGVGQGGALPEAVVGLADQHRMAAAIGEVVSRLAYAPALPLRHAAEPPPPAWPDPSARWVVVDAAGLGRPQPQGGSWAHPGHEAVAHAVIGRLLAADPEATVGYVAPFRAQARRVAWAWQGQPRVLAATVHRFQGAERDVMVVDTVLHGAARDHPFLGGGDGARRLWVVALSRARRQVVLVMPWPWPGDGIPALVRRLVAELGAPRVIPAAAILDEAAWEWEGGIVDG